MGAPGLHENAFWNSGMFAFTPDVVLKAFAVYSPQVLEAVQPVWRAIAARDASPMMEIDAALFAAVPDISIDYALTERAAGGSPGVVMVRSDFDWSDVGSWQAISDLVPADERGNRAQGEHVAIDTRNTFIHAEDRVVAAVGVTSVAMSTRKRPTGMGSNPAMMRKLVTPAPGAMSHSRRTVDPVTVDRKFVGAMVTRLALAAAAATLAFPAAAQPSGG